MPDGLKSNKGTKARLIEAAAEVFAQHGFRAATVRQICKRARTHVGSINYHFRDKKGLYSTIFGYALQQALTKYPPDLGLEKNATPEQRLRAFIYSLLLRIMADGFPAWHGKLMAQEIVEPSGAIDEVVEDSIRPIHLYLAEIVRDLMHEQNPESADEPETQFLTSLSIIGQCLHHYIARHIIETMSPQSFDPSSIEQITDHITRFSLGGIKAITLDL